MTVVRAGVVAWATDAIDEVRRRAGNDAGALACHEPRRGRGRPPHPRGPPAARGPPRGPGPAPTPAAAGAAPEPMPPPTPAPTAPALEHVRNALWQNPENLTAHQHIQLAGIARTDLRLCR